MGMRWLRKRANRLAHQKKIWLNDQSSDRGNTSNAEIYHSLVFNTLVANQPYDHCLHYESTGLLIKNIIFTAKRNSAINITIDKNV